MISVYFYTFAKRKNSTAQPVSGAVEMQCLLKDETSILNPTLEIQTAINPAIYTYAYIPDFSRYYFVGDWVYILGRWEVSLTVDAMASHKTEIGNSNRYILRAAAEYDKDVIDTFYPALGSKPLNYISTDTAAFSQDFESGIYVLGVAARSGEGAGAVTYYRLTAQQISDLVDYMFLQPSDLPTAVWTDGFSGLTDVLYRSIFAPFDYIKSCKWFPTIFAPLGTVNIRFGTFESNVRGNLLPLDATSWGYIPFLLSLPSQWATLEAKYKTKPNAGLFIVLNPFGVIELNPADFYDADAIRLKLYPDYISGEALLKIYKVIGTNDYFITQKDAQIAIDINLSSSSVNFSGVGASAVGFISAAAGLASGGLTEAVGIPLAAASAGSFVTSAAPTMANSVGNTTRGAVALDGVATLIYTSSYYADENITEFGRPLMKTRLIRNLSGYIKCGDGDISISGFDEERTIIEQFLTGGFFYE